MQMVYVCFQPSMIPAMHPGTTPTPAWGAAGFATPGSLGVNPLTQQPPHPQQLLPQDYTLFRGGLGRGMGYPAQHPQ